MDKQELADQLIDAWNRGAVADILRLMHSEATYHDAFWGETCSGCDLVRYLDTELSWDLRWYERDGEVIDTPDGVIVCYSAFDSGNPKRRKLLYKGAEVISLADELITGISDFYCHVDPVQLREIATGIENRRKEANVARFGLSAKKSGFIKRRLAELADNTTIFLEPELNPRQLADRVGCTVAHLCHVLEEEKETTFGQFVNERRVNFAATLLAEVSGSDINTGQIASQSGFENVEDFDEAFQTSFGMSATAYSRHAAQQTDCPEPEEPANTS